MIDLTKLQAMESLLDPPADFKFSKLEDAIAVLQERLDKIRVIAEEGGDEEPFASVQAIATTQLSVSVLPDLRFRDLRHRISLIGGLITQVLFDAGVETAIEQSDPGMRQIFAAVRALRPKPEMVN